MASLIQTRMLSARAPLFRQSRALLETRAEPARRAYATVRRPADDQKDAEEAEQGSEDLGDINMNGRYPDPSKLAETSALPLKRQLRDPYADWWDKQERRNYGEPVHEDNDILGIFSTKSYTHFTPSWGLVLMGSFLAALGGLILAVGELYPDKPSVPKVYPGGLDRELGGPGALLARSKEVTAEDWKF